MRRTVTFLFTDLENSTPLWERHPELMQGLAARHDALLQAAIVANDGRVVKTTGDGFHAVFDTATDAAAAALAAQQAILQEPWPAETGPMQVRMGLHTGESSERDGDFYGADVNRAARIMGIAHGSQIVLSGITATLIRGALPTGSSLIELGAHRLRGLTAPEQIHQLCHPELPAEFPPLKSLSVARHNLPVQLAGFVGRDKEMVMMQHMLRETRLLTLLGPGGTGKTRLMLECAETVGGDFADGVWLVELASLSDADLVAERVAATLDVREQPGRSPSASLSEYLQRKELLLLLDNVEHLVQACAELAQHLLAHCAQLTIVATGREALAIPGERTMPVPPLTLPPANGGVDVAVIAGSEAVQLFVARAQAVNPTFQLGEDNAAAIAEIVQQLDGIPLALELVTVRLRMLSVTQIAQRLEDRFRLLAGGRRTALPHQQTLQALIDWSWHLLNREEQALFRRLAVFSGGWTLEAVEHVAGDERVDVYELFDLLQGLVNKSLVTVQYGEGDEARYGMLETIRHYGLARLAEAGEEEVLREKHAAYFAALAEEAGPYLIHVRPRDWVRRVFSELDNYRAALKWTLQARPELALHMAGNLFYNEVYSFPLRERRSWLERVLEAARDEEIEGEAGRGADYLMALIGLGFTLGVQGDAAKAALLLEEAEELAERLGEPRHAANVLAGKQVMNPFSLTPARQEAIEAAIVTCRENQFHYELHSLLLVYAQALEAQGALERAKELFREAVALSRQGLVRYDVITFISVQFGLAHLLEDFEEERDFIADMLKTYEALNHRRGKVIGQSEMAHLLRREGRLKEAEAFYRQSIVGWLELGHRPAVAHQLECFAYMALAQGRMALAARLLGAAKAARQRLGAMSQDPLEITEQEQAMARLSTAMGEKERKGAMTEGSLLELEDAMQLALAS